MRSFGAIRFPTVARAPFTVIRPAAMAASMSRREPRPERARAVCTFSDGPAERGWARLRGDDGLVGSGRRSGRRGLRDFKRFDDFFQRRQLLQRAQPQIIEESL